MQDVSLVALIGRLVVSLAVVLALMAAAAWALRRHAAPSRGRGQGTAVIEIVARHGLSRTASIAVVRAGGKALVLGVTDASVNVLAEADGELMQYAPDPDRTSGPGGGDVHALRPWKNLIDTLRDRTVRRS